MKSISQELEERAETLNLQASLDSAAIGTQEQTDRAGQLLRIVVIPLLDAAAEILTREGKDSRRFRCPVVGHHRTGEVISVGGEGLAFAEFVEINRTKLQCGPHSQQMGGLHQAKDVTNLNGVLRAVSRFVEDRLD